MLIKSKIKYIQSLGHKKLRAEEGVFIAEGPKIVHELLLAQNAIIHELYAVKEWIVENEKLLDKINVVEITAIELEKISQLNTANQVVAVVKQFDRDVQIRTKDKIVLALDCIQDPGNLGTIIRIADWFAVDQVVCSNDSADIYNSKVVQATMGSIARVQVIYIDLQEWLSAQKDVRIYTTAMEGNDVTNLQKIKEGIIIIGNESRGVGLELSALANTKITIPHKARLNDSLGRGKVESLNAAVATGIILSHVI